jgi:hypothetical protein
MRDHGLHLLAVRHVYLGGSDIFDLAVHATAVLFSHFRHPLAVYVCKTHLGAFVQQCLAYRAPDPAGRSGHKAYTA